MANDGSQTLLTALNANGESAPVIWNRSRGQLDAWGAFGGGTLTLYHSPDEGTTWVISDAVSGFLTAPGAFEFDLAPGPIKVVLTGAAAPNVSAKVNRI